MNANPYKIVSDFEEMVAEWSGSKYAVATDSCTSAIFLSLMFSKRHISRIGDVVIPNKTYPSVACSIIHAGGKVKFIDEQWEGVYELWPFNIIDGALRFKKNMHFSNSLHCLSFHIKKLLPIGRGGMVLTDNIIARDWLRKARFDGRQPIPLKDDHFDMLGWNCYMTPDQAARGVQLFQVMVAKYPDGMEDLKVEEQGYPDLSKYPIYQQ